MNRRLVAGIMAGLIMTSSLTGCSGYDKSADNTAKTKNEEEISVSNNVTAAEGRILTGAAGYEKNGTKKALIACSIKDKGFAVLDKETGREEFRGRIRYEDKPSPDGKLCGICDFSSFDKGGSFYLQTDSGVCSGEFTVKEGLYKRLLEERTVGPAGSEPVQGRIDKDNIGKCFLEITDAVLAQEFFGNQSSGDNKTEVPESIEASKKQIAALQALINEKGEMDSSISDDIGICFGYSAVMSLFAYEYGQYDKKYADECKALAETSYKYALETYDKVSESDRKAVDDKLFWASAQLYKLTGKAAYKETAESYAKDPPEGFSEKRSGYLGTIAYLTCYNKIDLDTGEMFITELMEDINRVIKRGSVDVFLTASEEDGEEERVCEAFETARLMVLGNYITKNIKYLETAESYLSYLYGMNMLGKDYAYESGAVYFSQPQTFILAGLIDSYIYEDKQPEAMER